MIVHHGYRDGSGEFFVVVDTRKCDACGKCAPACPSAILEMGTVFEDLEDRPVAVVKEANRRELKGACAACPHPGNERCVKACAPGALAVIWSPATP